MNENSDFMLPNKPGVHLWSSNYNTLTGNMIFEGGIFLFASSNNNLDGNRITGNNYVIIEDNLSMNNVIGGTPYYSENRG